MLKYLNVFSYMYMYIFAKKQSNFHIYFPKNMKQLSFTLYRKLAPSLTKFRVKSHTCFIQTGQLKESAVLISMEPLKGHFLSNLADKKLDSMLFERDLYVENTT